MKLFLTSFLAGLILGMPIGPLGLVAMKRMMSKGALHGIFFGIGFAVVDILYTIIVGIGIHSISRMIQHYHTPLFIFAMSVFLLIGIRTFFSKPDFQKETIEKHRKNSLLGSTFMSFSLAATSPATFFAFSSVFSGMRISLENENVIHNVSVILGIVGGGLSLWILFSIVIHLSKEHLVSHFEKHLNHVMGSAMFVFVLFGILLYRAK